MLGIKQCPYCMKQRRKELMYREQERKNYKYKYICHLCRPSKLAGKKLNKKTRKWTGKRQSDVKIEKTKNIFSMKFTKKEHDNIGINYKCISDQTIEDFLD